MLGEDVTQLGNDLGGPSGIVYGFSWIREKACLHFNEGLPLGGSSLLNSADEAGSGSGDGVIFTLPIKGPGSSS